MKKFIKVIPFTIALLVLGACTTGGDSTPVDPVGSGGDTTIYVESIAIEGNTDLKKDETSNLTITYTPSNADDKSVTWSVLDSTVASITQSGIIKGLSAGQTTVKAVANGKDNVDIVATKTVNVSEEKLVQEYTIVSDIDSFIAGDELVLANGKKEVVASSIKNSYLTSVASTFSPDKARIVELAEDGEVFTLGGEKGAWTLKNSEGKFLGATGTKQIVYDAGETRWNIVKETNGIVIRNYNESYGTLCYNGSAPRFTTYQVASVVTPAAEIYRGKLGYPIYPTSISLSGKTELAVYETAQLSVSYLPEDTNQKSVSFASSDNNIASVGETGLVTAKKAGSVTITATAQTDKGNVKTTLNIKVKEIKVTSVTLDKTSAEVGLGKTLKLNPTVSPDNATNKSITWSSNNESVATVDDNGTVTAKKVGSATITVETVDGNKTATCDVEVIESKADAWTIMIYMCGADLESAYDTDEYGRQTSELYAAASADLSEILSVSGQPDDVNIIVETGGAKRWSSVHGISADYLERWHVEGQKLVKDARLAKANMGLVSTFQSFLEWGLTEYPAEKTALIMWNHGGAMQGVCYDELFNSDSLTNSEVHEGLTKAFKTLGRTEKLEWIGYDACLMAVQDIADFNSDFFNYMVASEESEVGAGYAYDYWVDDLYAGKSTFEVLTALTDGFIQAVDELYDYYYREYHIRYDNDQTQAILDLSKAAAYREKWETLAASIMSKTTSKNTFKSWITKNVKSYAYDTQEPGYDYYGLFDAYDFLTQLAKNSTYSSLSATINKVKEAYNELVIHNINGDAAGNSHGLGMFYPASSYCYTDYFYTTEETNYVTWRSFVKSYGY